jgi:hypothetical protein
MDKEDLWRGIEWMGGGKSRIFELFGGSSSSGIILLQFPG